MPVMTPEQQQERIDALTEVVNILAGELAALTAYAVVTGAPINLDLVRHLQGIAHDIAPNSVALLPKTPPKLAASKGVEKASRSRSSLAKAIASLMPPAKRARSRWSA